MSLLILHVWLVLPFVAQSWLFCARCSLACLMKEKHVEIWHHNYNPHSFALWMSGVLRMLLGSCIWPRQLQKRHLYTWLLGECSDLLMMSNIYFHGFTTCHTRLLWCFGWTCARCRLTFYFYLTSAIKTVITLFLQIDTTFDASHNLGALSEVNINAAFKYHTSIWSPACDQTCHQKKDR